MVRPEAAGSRSFLEVVAGTNNNVEVPAAEEAQAVVTIKAQVTVVAGRVTGELVAGEATATPAAPKKKTRKRVPKRRSELHSRLLALVKGQLLNRQQAQQKAQAAQETAKSRTEEEAEKVAQSQPLLVLPPSRKHATGAPEELVPHPVQVVEGYTVVYPVKEYELWTVMGEVEGWSLPLGEAEVRGGDVLARAAEEFSVVCGFSAAFGPLLLEHITAKVYEGTVVCGAKELPPEHLSHMFSAYWESEVAPFDSTERLFRLVSNPLRGGIGRRELQPFLLAIADRHPFLRMMSTDEKSIYIDTVLAVVFYKHSRCGVITLPDLRSSSDFVISLDAVGKMEGTPFETSAYWSVARHYRIREDYTHLSRKGWAVYQDGLRGYSQDGSDRVVGSLLAQRVIDAGLRPFPKGESPGCILSRGGGHGQAIDFDAFVCFFLCEEALRTETCSDRDIRYCFPLVDVAGEGRIGLLDLAPFYKDAVWENLSATGDEPNFSVIAEMSLKYFDSLGVEREREYITLQDMLKPEHIQRAGRFFEEVFAGTDFGAESYVSTGPHHGGSSDTTPRQALSSVSMSESISPGREVYPQDVLDFERELAGMNVHSSSET